MIQSRETIHFKLGECSLGWILVAATGIGVRAIALGDCPDELQKEFQTQFSNATLVKDDDLKHYVAQVVGLVESPSTQVTLPLDVRGTAFQMKVWKALQQTQPGQTLTYSELAQRIGSPDGARAVASACAQNNIALAIPCHRVVRADKSASGYRWGLDRKQTLLAREAKLN